MNNKYFHLIGMSLSAALIVIGKPTNAAIIDFEDLTLAPDSFDNGSDGTGGFTSGEAFFNNVFNPDFNSWVGWSYSNTTDTTTPGFVNQFSSFTGSGFDGSSNYAVAFTFGSNSDPFMPGFSRIELPENTSPKSVRITNTTYTALSMLEGDQFAKKFGGQTGNDPDFLLLTISGLDVSDNLIGTVEFFLADYRFGDNSQDFIVDTWNLVDLSSLSSASSLTFALSSSDNNPQFGLNTPAYVALDNLEVESINVPEASSTKAIATLGLLIIGYLKRKEIH